MGLCRFFQKSMQHLRHPPQPACSEGPLALSPRSSGTNFQSAPDGLISKSTGTADVPFTICLCLHRSCAYRVKALPDFSSSKSQVKDFGQFMRGEDL